MLGVSAIVAAEPGPCGARVDAGRIFRRALNRGVVDATEIHVFEASVDSLNGVNQPCDRQGGPR